MIGYIEGTLISVKDGTCLVLTGAGIGFRIALPDHALASLPPAGEKIALYTFMAVREDAIELYGFETGAERETFEILRGINKVGPKTALAILSRYRPEELCEIVAQENVSALTRVSGIGAKTAQHVYLELKYKLKADAISGAKKTIAPAIYNDAVAGLAGLGYGEDECDAIVREIVNDEPDLDVAGVIRLSLKKLGKRKQE